MSEVMTKPINPWCDQVRSTVYADFSDHLIDAAPEILWFDVQSVGSYSGEVFAVGVYKKESVVVFAGYYGSCSGCGAWGEGGEPKDLKEVLDNCKTFTELEEATKYYSEIGGYDGKPEIEEGLKAITAAFDWKNADYRRKIELAEQWRAR